MKILLINKFHYLAGGAERHMFDWADVLRAKGHEVSFFSMTHPRNRPCEQSQFFVEEVEFKTGLPLRDKLGAASRSVWNFEAGHRIEALLQSEGAPDIAHVHSFIFQLTPSVLKPLHAHGVPIIQTCHDYAPICVNQHLYNQRVNGVCEQCLRYGRLAPLWTRCIKSSFAASAAGCAAGLADVLYGRSRERILRFIAPSHFMRNKLIEGGLSPDRVFEVPNFANSARLRPAAESGDYVLFFGRLIPQKGPMTFLEAARRTPHIPCKLLGGGPMEMEVRRLVERQSLTHVEVLGHQEGEALEQTVRRARAVVVPSEWYEPFGLVLLEAMAAARPVIASRIAGPSEIVSDGRDGILYEQKNAEELARAYERLWNDPQLAVEMGLRGREKVERDYNAEMHYMRMIRHFEELK